MEVINPYSQFSHQTSIPSQSFNNRFGTIRDTESSSLTARNVFLPQNLNNENDVKNSRKIKHRNPHVYSGSLGQFDPDYDSTPLPRRTDYDHSSKVTLDLQSIVSEDKEFYDDSHCDSQWIHPSNDRIKSNISNEPHPSFARYIENPYYYGTSANHITDDYNQHPHHHRCIDHRLFNNIDRELDYSSHCSLPMKGSHHSQLKNVDNRQVSLSLEKQEYSKGSISIDAIKSSECRHEDMSIKTSRLRLREPDFMRNKNDEGSNDYEERQSQDTLDIPGSLEIDETNYRTWNSIEGKTVEIPRSVGLMNIVDHGAWYNLKKKKKKKVGDKLEAHSADEFDTRSAVSLMPESEQRRHSLTPNLLTPASIKKKKGWGSIIGFGGSKKKKERDVSRSVVSFSSSFVSRESGSSLPSSPTIQAPHKVQFDEDQMSAISGYTGLSGVSGKSVVDFGVAVAEEHQKKKKKGILEKIFGSSSKVKSSMQLNSQTLAQLDYQNQGPDGKVIKPPALSEVAEEETAEQRLERIRQETREDFLHAVSRVQQRFVARQVREQAIRRNRVSKMQETGSGLTPPFKKSEERDLLQLSTALEGKDTIDLTEVDWTKIESESQYDAIKMLFVLNKLRQLINQMFDDEGFVDAMNELEKVSYE